MQEIRYAENKPKDCSHCNFWDRKTKACRLGTDNCYYMLPEKEDAEPESPCKGCPYGAIYPCIGYCLRKLQEGMNR
jgi:hypothetical protein